MAFLCTKRYNVYTEKAVEEMLEKSRDMRGEIKIIDIESLMPKEHLLRKIDRVIDFNDIYMK